MSNPELVTALDLDQWSESLASKFTLPVLVRRLILATAHVTEINMRGREGVALPGWDGQVHSDVDDPHVPRGASGWELGTSRDPRHKAQSDMRDRIQDPQGVDPGPPRTSPSRAACGVTAVTGVMPGARTGRGPTSAPMTLMTWRRGWSERRASTTGSRSN